MLLSLIHILCAVIFVVGCPDKQCGNGQRRSLGQINVRGEFHAVAHRHVERTQHGSTVKRTGGIILPQRQRRIFLEDVYKRQHQCSKLPREEWDAYLAWLFDFEYRKIAIPEPDTVVYLDVDPEVSQRLMSQRYHGDEEKKDIHEKNMEYLQHSRQAGQYCAKALGWKRVACTEGGRMRAKEDIHKDVLALIAKR